MWWLHTPLSQPLNGEADRTERSRLAGLTSKTARTMYPDPVSKREREMKDEVNKQDSIRKKKLTKANEKHSHSFQSEGKCTHYELSFLRKQ